MSVHLTRDAFIKQVFDFEKNNEWKYEGKLPAVIDFWAPWCGPCRMVGPILDELAVEYKDRVHVYKVNVDEEQELAGLFGVRSIPTMLFIPATGLPKVSVGALPKEALKQAIEQELLGVVPAKA
jgi:thioredoxin